MLPRIEDWDFDVIASDVDEVLFPYIDVLLPYHNRLYGTALTREDIFCYGLHNIVGVSQSEMRRRLDIFEATPEFQNIQPSPKVVRMVKQIHAYLSGYGKSQETLTARVPLLTQFTKEFLDSYFAGLFAAHGYLEFGENNQPTNTKADVCKERGAGLLIDDSFETAQVCAQHGIYVVQPRLPWNTTQLDRMTPEEQAWITPVDNLEDIATVIGAN